MRRGWRRSAPRRGSARSTNPVRPELLYLDDAGWDRALAGRAVRELSGLPRPLGPGIIDAGGRIGRDFIPERQQEALSLFGALAAHVAARRRVGNVVLASYSKGARERMAGLLADSGVTDAREIATADATSRRRRAGSISRSGGWSTGSRRRT